MLHGSFQKFCCASIELGEKIDESTTLKRINAEQQSASGFSKYTVDQLNFKSEGGSRLTQKVGLTCIRVSRQTDGI